MRFCQSFMTELFRHIGPDTDVPAGDIGVGGREIGFLFGQYRRLRNEFAGVLTGKGLNWGGSLIRTEATGFGCVYFAAEMLATRGQTLEGKTCLVSGSGNVAQFPVEKLLDLGAKVVTLSDSSGFIYDEAGIDRDEDGVRPRPEERPPRPHPGVRRQVQGRASSRPRTRGSTTIRCGTSRPTARSRARRRTRSTARTPRTCSGTASRSSSEAANMPTTLDGVTSSSTPASSTRPARPRTRAASRPRVSRCRRTACAYAWTREEVDQRLQDHHEEHPQGVRGNRGPVRPPGNYVNGANIAGFLKVADSMMDQGLV